MKKLLAVALILALILPLPSMAGAAGDTASNITKHCAFKASSNPSSFRKAVDGNTSTVWNGKEGGGQSVDITVDAGYDAGALYIRWNTEPPAWTLYAVSDDGSTEAAASGGGNGYLSEYVAISPLYSGSGNFKLDMEGEGKASIAELSVYGEGNAPSFAPRWQPFSGRVDVMVVSAHPDDDQLYLGAVVPTYAQQRKKSVTVFMTYGKPLRRFEALEGVWTAGGRVYPVFGPFIDKLTYSIEDAARYWPKDKVLSFLVEQIRKYKPAVIVTHGIAGEYGHGAHMLTSQLVQKAFDKSGDPDYDPGSAEEYGVWNPAKLYLHKYGEDKLTIDTSVPLPLYGGMTAFEVAKAGYDRHVSQHVWSFKVSDTGRDSIREFGLFATRVGLDEGHDDMFENVTAETLSGINPQYVDKTALASAIRGAEAIAQSPFGMLRWAAAGLRVQLAHAGAVMDDGSATQADVNEAIAGLHKEMDRIFSGPWGYR